MTAAAPAVSRTRPVAIGWPSLVRVAWLRHRTALLAFIGFAALASIGMALTGITLHAAGYGASSRLFAMTTTVLMPALLSLPALAGMFLGAPLVAREYETGTSRFG